MMVERRLPFLQDEMKIEVICMMYNEEFLAPYFCQHYNFADRIRVVVDTDTNDRTVEILSRYPNVELEYFTFPDMMDDKLKIDRLQQAYRESDADWVMMPDADEFIFTTEHPKIKSVRDYLESRNFLDVISVLLYQIYRHRTDEDLVLEKGIWQRRHGDDSFQGWFASQFIKPIVVRSHKRFTWRPGFHKLIDEEPLRRSAKYHLRGAHWYMADPCFCIERRLKGRRDRQSKNNIRYGMSKHQYFITKDSLLDECKAHLDDPQVIFGNEN
jgi:hypothetical protein